jgi:hypothetical protein
MRKSVKLLLLLAFLLVVGIIFLAAYADRGKIDVQDITNRVDSFRTSVENEISGAKMTSHEDVRRLYQYILEEQKKIFGVLYDAIGREAKRMDHGYGMNLVKNSSRLGDASKQGKYASMSGQEYVREHNIIVSGCNHRYIGEIIFMVINAGKQRICSLIEELKAEEFLGHEVNKKIDAFFLGLPLSRLGALYNVLGDPLYLEAGSDEKKYMEAILVAIEVQNRCIFMGLCCLADLFLSGSVKHTEAVNNDSRNVPKREMTMFALLNKGFDIAHCSSLFLRVLGASYKRSAGQQPK